MIGIVSVKGMEKMESRNHMHISPTELPDVLLKYVGKQGYTVNNVGMSGSEVCIYEKYIRKIQPENDETDNENRIGHRIPVPSIPAYCVQNGLAFAVWIIVSKGCIPEERRYLTLSRGC